MTRIPPGASEVAVPSLCLVVLDGWGLAPDGPGNAVSQANTPVFHELWERYPRTTLSASGADVGLPEGQMGNSEVGHINLGAGAIVKQDLARIDDAIADGSFFENEALRAACEAARRSPRGRLHLLGLVSDGGVHSGWEHIEACIELAAQEGVPDLVIHAFTDGRDTLPKSAPGYISELERWLRHAGRIGTVAGRYYAMDRDRRWERTKLAYDAIVHAEGLRADSAAAAIADAYERGETDEFIRPTVIGDYDGVADGDVAVHLNFRPDRARQLFRALAEPEFDEFDRGDAPRISLTTLTEHRRGWSYPVAFPPREPETTLAEVLAARGERQLHVAETEKYAHVTYFFNGGREREWEGEERCLVDSPRDVPTYDHRPEMSARAAANEFCERWSA
ncbi:MAG: 2,3-bisphosphoglycerate-independent phosphoglycerate mutase, partial [Solirubrobacterales bacterium]